MLRHVFSVASWELLRLIYTGRNLILLFQALRHDTSQRRIHDSEPLFAVGPEVPEAHGVGLGHSPLSFSGKGELIPDRKTCTAAGDISDVVETFWNRGEHDGRLSADMEFHL